MSSAARTRHISLVGMMGVGKTTVGKMLARELDWLYYDNDAEIERTVGKPIPQIFVEDGEPAFRDLEAQLLEQAVKSEQRSVVSVGGGAIMRPTNRHELATNTYVVWLTAPLDVLITRVSKRHKDRPMLQDNPGESMRRLYAERQPIYSQLADLEVGDHGGPRKVVRTIVGAVR